MPIALKIEMDFQISISIFYILFFFTDLLLVTTNVIAAPNINTDTSTTVIFPVFSDVASCVAVSFVAPSYALFDITSFAGIFISILSSNFSSYSGVVVILKSFYLLKLLHFRFHLLLLILDCLLYLKLTFSSHSWINFKSLI